MGGAFVDGELKTIDPDLISDKSALEKSENVKLAPLKSAPVKLAPMKSAPYNAASEKSAPVKLAPSKFMKNAFILVKLAPVKTY